MPQAAPNRVPQSHETNRGLGYNSIHPKYREDIDGLRAIAVQLVVGFHCFPFHAFGGFIGVDIFFAISGFLISGIIFGNLGRDNFSFAGFYSRRIKRIFPALLVVLIASYAIGWCALLSDEYKQLGKHVFAAVDRGVTSAHLSQRRGSGRLASWLCETQEMVRRGLDSAKVGSDMLLHCHTIVLHNENSQGVKALIYKG